MSVNSYLSELASSMVLTESEEDSIETSISTIKNRLGLYFGSEIREKKVFGSYKRGTILPRKIDDKSDVDLMVVFYNTDHYKPQSFLNRLKDFANYYYRSSIVYQSKPTIVLELNHIKFELTPAYVEYGSYYIPDGPDKWMFTDPDRLHDDLVKCNKDNSYKIKPAIRLTKHWNIQKNYRKMASYRIEERIVEDLKYAYYSCSSTLDYVKKALSSIKYYTDIDRVNAALDHINKAVEYEQNGMPYSAMNEIKKAFPEV